MHKFIFIIHFVVAFLFIFYPFRGFGTEKYLPQKHLQELGLPVITNYSPKDYAEHSQNWAVIQDSRGVIYFGNGHGILEYDGVSWRLIETSKSTRVRSFARDENGRIYVGASGDFGYLAPDSLGQLQYISLLEYLKYEDLDFTEVWRTHVTTQGVYFQTFNKLFRWSDNRINVWNSDSEFYLSAVVHDTLYLEHREKGLMKMIGDSLTLIPASKPYVPLRTMSILPFDNNSLLLCTNRQGLILFRNREFKPFSNNSDDFLRENLISSASILPDSTIALATYRGGILVMDREGRWLNTFNSAAGLLNNDVKYIYADNSGILWAALNYGISKLNISSPFSFFTEQQGINGLVSSLIRHRGTLYAATSQGVYYLTAARDQTNSYPRFQQVEGIALEAFSLLSTSQNLLAATNVGLYIIEHNKAVPIKGLNDPIFFLYRSRIDTTLLYAGLGNGMAIYRNRKQYWEYTGQVQGITEEIRSIVEQEGGILWLGTMQQGVFRIVMKKSNPGKLISIEKMTSDIFLPFGQIMNLDERILLLTDKGLKSFDNANHNLKSSYIFGEELAENNRWISQIFKINPGYYLIHNGVKNIGEYWLAQKSTTQNYLIDKTSLRILLHFGTIYSSYTDKNNIVWFGCNTGIVRFDPSQTVKLPITPEPLIRRVLSLPDSVVYGGGNLTQTLSFILPYKNNALRFEYSLPAFEETSDNQFQYFLEGFDKNWSEWTYETRKDYTNLPEGNYQFKIRARNVFHRISTGNTFLFEILPPWYRSWWAYGAYLLIFLFGLFGIDRVQRARLVKREQQRARIREAEIIHDKNLELQQINLQLENLLKSLQISQAEVMESESRFRSVAEHASDAIITADQKGIIRFWNRRAEIIFGYKPDEIIGKSLTTLMPKRHRQAHRKGMNRLITTGETRISGKVVEIQAIRKSGEEFPIELTVSHWKTTEGIFVTGIIRDITTRKKQQEALQKTTAQLKEAYHRKSEELEKARRLQLSMLPAELPQLPHLEMDAYMKTASEVGGDYYDIHLGDKQTLTIVIGDATGHGMEAGMLVTATKSLFLKLAEEPDIVSFMQQMNEALKRLKLKKLYMAFQVVRITGYTLEVCSAGMPPLLIYNKKKNRVEEVLLKALPLGGFSGVVYQKKEYSLSSGDVVLLFSDGFPERFNERGEMLDYNRVKTVLQEVVFKNPENIIRHLIQIGETWAGKQAQHDDETFVVLKVK